MASVKRSAIVWALAVAAAGSSAVLSVDQAWKRMEQSQTGRARWIWVTGGLPSPRPVSFTASRSLLIEEPVQYARVKIFVDPSYRLYLDGAFVGSGRMKPGDPMDLYDLSQSFPKGPHEFSIEAQSPTGLGGILFGLDISGHGRNAVVSDESWRIDGARPFVWGDPPIYPWRFPGLARAESASRAAAQ